MKKYVNAFISVFLVIALIVLIAINIPVNLKYLLVGADIAGIFLNITWFLKKKIKPTNKIGK